MRDTESGSLGSSTSLFLAFLIYLGLILLAAQVIGNDRTLTNRNRELLLFVLVAFHLPTLLRSTVLYALLSRNMTRRRNRLSSWHVVQRLLNYFPLLLVLIITYGRNWTFSSIGFDSSIHWGWSVSVGIGSAIAFERVVARVYRLRARSSNSWPSAFDIEIVRIHLSRGTKAQAFQFFETTVLSPVFEDLIYRGFFVYFWGNLLGSPLAGIVIGFIFCIWLHMYMGREKLLSVALFFAASVTLLHSPFGLTSTIAFHATCNARYMINLKSHALRYLTFVHNRRQTANTPDRVIQPGM